MSPDPTEEIREIKQRLAAKFDFDLRRIAEDKKAPDENASRFHRDDRSQPTRDNNVMNERAVQRRMARNSAKGAAHILPSASSSVTFTHGRVITTFCGRVYRSTKRYFCRISSFHDLV